MDIALRATVIFVALYLLVRLMGKRELGQMTPFELIVLVVIGDLIQQGITHNDFSLSGATLAIFTFAFVPGLVRYHHGFAPGEFAQPVIMAPVAVLFTTEKLHDG